MDFDLRDEQRLLKDSVERLIGDVERFRRAAPDHRRSDALWRRYAEMGLLALPFPERFGGFGGGPVETMIVMEAIGRGLALEPYLSTVILGGGLLRLGAGTARCGELMPRIAEGALRLALAHGERQARYDLHDVATVARRRDGAYVIDGTKSAVLGGDRADLLIVSARTAGARRDPDGITLFLVDATAPGLTIEGYSTQDDRGAAEIALAGVAVGADAVVGAIDAGLPLIEQVTDLAIAAVAAEAVGAMDALVAITIDHLKTRRQFGTTIGSFQSLQHRAVDMMVALEQARSMALYAAMMADEEPAERRPALSAAKVQINRSARFVGQQAVQLHGGIGMTREHKASHYFRRLAMIEPLLGDTDHHLRIVAQAGGVVAAGG